MDMIVSLMNKNEKCEMITEARHAYGTIGKYALFFLLLDESCHHQIFFLIKINKGVF